MTLETSNKITESPAYDRQNLLLPINGDNLIKLFFTQKQISKFIKIPLQKKMKNKRAYKITVKLPVGNESID